MYSKQKIFDTILGFIVLLILPVIVYEVTLFSIPLGLAIIVFIFQIMAIIIVEKIKEVKETGPKKESFRMFNVQTDDEFRG